MAHCRLTHRTPDHHSGLRFSNVPGYRSVIPVIPFTSPKGERDLWSLKTFTRAFLFQIAREKSCDYVLIIYMEKYEMAHHN